MCKYTGGHELTLEKSTVELPRQPTLPVLFWKLQEQKGNSQIQYVCWSQIYESKVWSITKVRCNQLKYLVSVGAQLQLHVMSSADVIEEDCSRFILPATRCKINADQI